MQSTKNRPSPSRRAGVGRVRYYRLSLWRATSPAAFRTSALETVGPTYCRIRLRVATAELCRDEPEPVPMPNTRDPIAFELFKNAIFSIADEMALTVLRTTYSGVLKDNMDYSTGFADADGKLAAQGLTLPAHLGSVPTAMDSIMRHFCDDIVPGDVFIMNDPFDGGMHLPDIFVIKPLLHEGERLAFACTVCHHIDVGGRVAGSNASDSTEIYAEGL